MRALKYSDIGLISRNISTLDSRDEADTSVEFAGQKLTVPLIAAPMPDVCDGTMAGHLLRLGAYGFIHRFNTIEEQANEYKLADCDCGCAIGINGDCFERFQELAFAGCRSFCLDVANGANTRVKATLEKLMSLYSDVYFTVGNVASKECYEWLCDLNIYAIRCGIAGGSSCTTRVETGLFYPMASSVLECASVKSKTMLIADGSIKEPRDICKALVLGADICMAGCIFAGTEESPSKTLRLDGQLMKIYKGAASFSTQKQVNKKPKYVEGMETLIPYTGPLEKIIHRFRNGLRSSMSYMNSRTIAEYQKKSDWTII